MKHLLNKEHYCYKILKLLMKSSAYPYSPFYKQLPYLYELYLVLKPYSPSMIIEK